MWDFLKVACNFISFAHCALAKENKYLVQFITRKCVLVYNVSFKQFYIQRRGALYAVTVFI